LCLKNIQIVAKFVVYLEHDTTSHTQSFNTYHSHTIHYSLLFALLFFFSVGLGIFVAGGLL